jgi:hypothetical protein
MKIREEKQPHPAAMIPRRRAENPEPVYSIELRRL